MQIRDNVRERRRERIEQLIGQQAIEKAKRTEQSLEDSIRSERIGEGAIRPDQVKAELHRIGSNPVNPKAEIPRVDLNPTYPREETSRLDPPYPSFGADPDPELWWREREKRMKSGKAAGWQGLKGIPPASSAKVDNPPGSFDINKLIRGFTLRLLLAATAFAGIWGWFKLEMPGSAETRDWMVSSVTRDMDFEAIEAWYGDTFGGSPSFFPFNRDEPDTKEVSALLDPAETAIPVQGRIVQSYAQNGTGVKVAASGGSEVYAIFTGLVQTVTQDQDGGVTIIVQHQNRILTVYGGLEKATVKPNDWVQTGQQVGQLNLTGDGQSEGVLYFAVQQNGKTLNPAEVVSFD